MQNPRMVQALFGLRSVATLGALGALALAGCASNAEEPQPSGQPSGQPTGQSDIEVRHTDPVVSGSAFQCTGTWPSQLTPCGYAWSSQPATLAVGTTADSVELILQRRPIPVDGGASSVYLKLKFASDGTVSASATETTTAAGMPRVIETSDAVSGFVDPAVMGRSPGVRNAGKFSLTFAWGSISGTYDTAQ